MNLTCGPTNTNHAMQRRHFLRLSALTSPLLALRGRLQAMPRRASGPVVISTWDFGKAANAEAWKVLSSGGRSLDAVEAGVKVPEADPDNHTVGYSGFPDRDGHVTLDACIMDELGNCGSVMALEHVTHAISVARLVMEKTPHVALVGEGAYQFAMSQGFKKENLLTPESEAAWKEWLKREKYEPVMNIENMQWKDKKDDP